MRKTILSVLVLAAVSMAATNTIYIDGGDVRIKPYTSEYRATIKMHTDADCDRWVINGIFPQGLTPVSATPLEGMHLTYQCDNGEVATHDVPLCHSNGFDAITAFVGINQYFSDATNTMHDNIFKWSAGEYDLLEITLNVGKDFRCGDIMFNGIMDCSADGIDNVQFYSVINVVVGYDCGDVNGDGQVSIADVSAIIDHLLGGELDEYQREAADTNTDGDVSIADVSQLIDMML